MNNWQKLKETWIRLRNHPSFKNMASSPVPKILGINTVLFLMWRINLIPETFLVKHFSFDRLNISEHRYHTLLTYGFSHWGFFSYLFSMIVIGSFGKGLRMQFGNKIIWMLYIVGAMSGGLSMYFGMPHMPMVVPQVGSDASVSAMITFYGMFNLQNQVLLFFFPVRMWVLLGIMGVYCLYEPTKKNLGGMIAGLMIYQLFKVRMI